MSSIFYLFSSLNQLSAACIRELADWCSLPLIKDVIVPRASVSDPGYYCIQTELSTWLDGSKAPLKMLFLTSLAPHGAPSCSSKGPGSKTLLPLAATCFTVSIDLESSLLFLVVPNFMKEMLSGQRKSCTYRIPWATTPPWLSNWISLKSQLSIAISIIGCKDSH